MDILATSEELEDKKTELEKEYERVPLDMTSIIDLHNDIEGLEKGIKIMKETQSFLFPKEK